MRANIATTAAAAAANIATIPISKSISIHGTNANELSANDFIIIISCFQACANDHKFSAFPRNRKIYEFHSVFIYILSI